MKAGMSKTGHKYLSRKKVKGNWVYIYKQPTKLAFPKSKRPTEKGKKLVIATPKGKSKVEDYYGKGRHKYFKTEADKKNFLEMQKKGMTGGRGQKIKSTMGRIKKGTKISIIVNEEKVVGNIVGSNGTPSRSPTEFDVQYSVGKKVFLKRGIPREEMTRETSSWYQRQTEAQESTKKDKKKQKMRTENRAMLMRDVDDEVQKAAADLVMAHWDMFSKMAGAYYDRRLRGGWDANKFGFTKEDLKQETYLVVHNAAISYLTNPAKDKRATFTSYTKSFLKSNLALRLAIGSGAGGHLKASAKDQLYIWFFKDTLHEYRMSHKGMYPSDIEMLEMLEKKRKSLPDVKGNKTIIDYGWNIEKVKNKRSMARKMESLDRTIESAQGGADTLLSILNDEELEIPGHYKVDPWQETQKVVVREGVEAAIKRKFVKETDRQILIRLYGLFINEDSPQEMRKYAMGQSPSEVARELDRIEASKNNKRRWTSGTVIKREEELLRKLKDDKDFKLRMKSFVKAEKTNNQEWPDTGLIIYYILCYKIISDSIDRFFPATEGEGADFVFSTAPLNEAELTFKVPKGLEN